MRFRVQIGVGAPQGPYLGPREWAGTTSPAHSDRCSRPGHVRGKAPARPDRTPCRQRHQHHIYGEMFSIDEAKMVVVVDFLIVVDVVNLSAGDFIGDK